MHLCNVIVFQVDFMIDKSNCLYLSVWFVSRKIYWNVGSLYPWSFWFSDDGRNVAKATTKIVSLRSLILTPETNKKSQLLYV